MRAFSPLLIPLFGSACLAGVWDFDISIRDTYRTIQWDLGTPGAAHNLLYDTGSATLWVLDGTCTDKCPNSSKFPRSKYNLTSTGKAYYNTTGSIEYDGGKVFGHLVSDIAGIPGTNVSFRQKFASITSSSWSSLGSDGFLGLASSSIAFTNTTSPFENAMQQGLLDKPRFSIYHGAALSTESNPSPQNNGVLTMGGSHEDVYADGEVQFFPIETPFEVYKANFLGLSGTRHFSGQNKQHASLNWTGAVVFDTGSGLSEIPESKIEAVYNMTPWTYEKLMTGYRPLCSEFNDTWSVSFTFGSHDDHKTFKVTGDQLATPGYEDDEHCFPPFNPWSSSNIILGANWMGNFYSVFDFGSFEPSNYDLRIGFAPLKKKYQPKV
ncbi:Aspartic proteinase yapsin-3 [Talaromyces islandicus]|uniref:Aspartic proteinase yapsin-3 n=1 Tax=Talaromyces islandicus TaxID=28573 RepID=A0A0U1M4T2_TALIS|nr:Aspartic proteinase yapsin-3 [Talaromyces islandicus]